MSVLGREQRAWRTSKKNYLATESVIHSLDMKPIRVHGEKGSWRGKVEPVMSPETGSLGHKGIVAQSSFHRSKRGKRWHSTTAIKILAMIESRNKNNTTTG